MQKTDFKFTWGSYQHSKMNFSMAYEEFIEKKEKGCETMIYSLIKPWRIRLSSESFIAQCTTLGVVLSIHTQEGKQIYKYDGTVEIIKEHKSDIGFLLSALARVGLHQREYITCEPNYKVRKDLKTIETYLESYTILRPYIVLEREDTYQIMDPLLGQTIHWINKSDVLSTDRYYDDEME